MNKLLVQWVLVISSLVLVTGCTSGGDLPEEEAPAPFFDPLPEGSPVFSEINEPFLAPSTNNSEALSLFSYKTSDSALDIASPTEIFSTDSGVILSLNTVEGQSGEIEFSVFARNDSVYLIDHMSNQIRLLSHFVNKVCELIPVEIVTDAMTVLHDELVYVMTAEPSASTDACRSDSKKRFYALPLDHQLDPTLEPDGELKSLDLVNEAKARAKLIFGWVPDPSQPAQDIMTYGYLGFSVEQQELSLFDENRELVWTQERALQRFEQVMVAPETFSDKYIFHIQALKNGVYLIQLGLDVFIVDSGRDLLTKTPNDVSTLLNDKVLSVELRLISNENADADARYYALPVEAYYDDDDLLLIDNAKIYRLAYQAGIAVRNPSLPISTMSDVFQTLESKDYLRKYTFSQFALKACADDEDSIRCENAHDVEAQTWQFLTPCDEQFGCVLPQNTGNFCQTREEFLQTQADEPEICSPSNYKHIAELNKPENDAQLLAFMQYADKYVRNTDFILENDRLYITARMNEKDIFLAYDFNQDFSAPKALREQVIFGKRAVLAGLDAYFSDDNLFLTALTPGAVRVNECYKEGKRVACQLNELSENGGGAACTGKDLAEKLCANQFTEYESKALFCSANQVADFSCSDAVSALIDGFAIESAQEDAKWLPIYDHTSAKQEMYLLTGDNQTALVTENLDEGKLYLPNLFRVDQADGQKIAPLGRLSGTVESVVNGVLYKEPSVGNAEVFGRLRLISDDINQEQSQVGQIRSTFADFLLEQTFETSASTTPDEIKALKVAERSFDKL